MSKGSRKALAKLPISEKLKLLAKLCDRSLTIADSRRKKAEAKREGVAIRPSHRSRSAKGWSACSKLWLPQVDRQPVKTRGMTRQ